MWTPPMRRFFRPRYCSKTRSARSMSTPNLVSFLPVVVLACVLRVDVGVDADRADRLSCRSTPATRSTFSISASDSRLNAAMPALIAVGDLLVGLADAGVDHLLRVAAGLERAEQLAAAGDVKPAALVGEELADVDVAAALDRVADRRRSAA